MTSGSRQSSLKRGIRVSEDTVSLAMSVVLLFLLRCARNISRFLSEAVFAIHFPVSMLQRWPRSDAMRFFTYTGYFRLAESISSS